MKKSKDRPYVLFVAEVIYKNIVNIKSKNPELSNLDAIDAFIGSDIYGHISSGKFHDEWLRELEQNKYIDKKQIKLHIEILEKYGKTIPNIYNKNLQDCLLRELP